MAGLLIVPYFWATSSSVQRLDETVSLTCWLKFYAVCMSFSSAMSNLLGAVDSHFLCVLMRMKPVNKWWSLYASAPLRLRTSNRELLHFPLIAMWSIWFLVWRSGRTQKTLWTFFRWLSYGFHKVLQISHHCWGFYEIDSVVLTSPFVQSQRNT